MQASKVAVRATDLEVIVQGFKGSEGHDIKPYVLVGIIGEVGWTEFSGELSPESAHILSEEIRKHAEFAASAEQGE